MNKDHARFLVSGILFGFLVGYLVAYGIHEPRVKTIADPVPEAGNSGMASGPPMGGGMPPSGAAPAGGPPQNEVMEKVFAKVGALKDAIQKNPRDVAALTQLANFYQDAGKFDQAVGYYHKALEISPNDVNPRTDMGICLREMGQPDEAIKEFRRSIAIDPKHWQTWLNLGIVSLYDKHDPATAASAFGKVEELNPSYPDLAMLKDEVRKARAGSS